MVLIKKSTLFRHKRRHRCYEDFDIRLSSFCDTIAINYDKIVVKIFIKILLQNLM